MEIFERCDNNIHDIIEIVEYISVPETKHREILARKMRVTHSIASKLVLGAVCISIDFDHQSVREARKVHDQMIERHLLPKFPTSRLEPS